MNANVRNKDDVKAKILLHEFSVNAAVETPPNELSMLMRESMRIHSSVN